MIRRLIKWLARREIMQAYEAGSKIAQVLGEQASRMRQDCSYAAGYMEGARAAYESLERVVSERGGIFANEDDLELAKKGSVH